MRVPASRLSEPGATRLTLATHRGGSSQRLVRQPRSVRDVALALALALPLLLLLLLVTPWQQSATGTGRVVAWAPANRQQTVDAPIDGRLVSWHVQEGQVVKAGDLLVELRDNDPNWLTRLESQQDAALTALTSAEQQVESYRSKLAAQVTSRDLTIAEVDAKIASLVQKRVGEQSEYDTAVIQESRQAALLQSGIISSRAYELARLSRDKAAAALQARDQQIAAERNARDKRAADADTKIASVRAELQAAEAKVAEARQKQLDAQGKVARQATQRVTAPADGIIQAVHGGPGGTQVKTGDRLVTIVPDTADRAVELKIDGNDMPLIQPGEEVRLLFEGWPALQFVGLPGASRGTFAGTVSWVDPSDDGSGKFRIVVVPDPEQEPWPSPQRLRQGVRAKGFVLLTQVSLGYELWRQVNGFPPLPTVDKGDGVPLPTNKKPRAPMELK